VRFQQRDGDILQTIYENDGVMAKRHLKNKFWPDKSSRSMEQRLSKLFKAGYLLWPNREHYKIYPIPEPICWFGWRGIDYLAAKNGIRIERPKSNNENQLREFQKELRKQGIRWVREPRWSLLRHDLAVNDFRFAIEKAVGEIKTLSMEKWVQESKFRSKMDAVAYKIKYKNGKFKSMKKGICPDSYFEIVDEKLRSTGELYRARFLLELDMSTHDNLRFGREKAIPGVAYIKSKEFKTRFGYNNGYWLIVTNGGHRRLRNLMRQTEEKTGDHAKLFFFTSLDNLGRGNILTSPIWQQVDRQDPNPLFEGKFIW